MEARIRFTKAEKSWVAYDAGNSAFTMIVSSIIPIYFNSLTARGGVNPTTSAAWWGLITSLSTRLLPISSPLLGPIADFRGMKIKLFTGSLIVGLAAGVAMGIVPGWAGFAAVFVVAKIGYNASLVFYDSMLTDITPDERMDTVSAAGYGIGYISSCVPFILCIVLILTADATGLGTETATRLSFVITCLWWGLFTIPLFKTYRQTYFVARKPRVIRESLRTLGRTLKGMRSQKHVLFFMLAFFFYIDGVYTIIGMAASYGSAVGIDDTQMILALLLTQIIAFPFAILFGRLAKRFHARRLIEACIIGYFGITLFALQLDRAWEFWFLAVCVAMFQGGIQSLSRSYFARIIPKEHSNEYFGLFNIFGKGADFLGPLLMSVTMLFTRQANLGVLPLLVLFAIGFVFMRLLPKEEQVSRPIA
jgi:UMF1 family MFS transporter